MRVSGFGLRDMGNGCMRGGNALPAPLALTLYLLQIAPMPRMTPPSRVDGFQTARCPDPPRRNDRRRRLSRLGPAKPSWHASTPQSKNRSPASGPVIRGKGATAFFFFSFFFFFFFPFNAGM